jgi:hypothetical protein
MFTPYQDLHLDGFTILTEETWPARQSTMRRWLENDRVNALRQSTIHDFKAYVTNPLGSGFLGPLSSATGTTRCQPNAWIYGAILPGATRVWGNDGWMLTVGIPVAAPFVEVTGNNVNLNLFYPLEEPVLLVDGCINWEIHNTSNATLTAAKQELIFLTCEPRPEISGELISFCKDSQAVSF